MYKNKKDNFDMYVTSILSNLFKLNAKMRPEMFEQFRKFVNNYNSENEAYCYCDQLVTGYAVYYCTDLELGKDLVRLFKISQGEPAETAFSNATGIKSELYKYVANFHTSEAADEFLSYLSNIEFENFRGVDKKIRNSVIFYCLYSEIGYDIAKQFENQYLTQVLKKPLSEPIKKVHPIEENDKIYNLEVKTVEVDNKLNKIFSIFKGNSSD
jgi:hypothetical protein